ncbi:hypothetical protein CPB97_001758 [Podila verticillata]|nr:hypothetical protein CPB97_001758 [Podila verticillata]
MHHNHYQGGPYPGQPPPYSTPLHQPPNQQQQQPYWQGYPPQTHAPAHGHPATPIPPAQVLHHQQQPPQQQQLPYGYYNAQPYIPTTQHVAQNAAPDPGRPVSGGHGRPGPASGPAPGNTYPYPSYAPLVTGYNNFHQQVSRPPSPVVAPAPVSVAPSSTYTAAGATFPTYPSSTSASSTTAAVVSPGESNIKVQVSSTTTSTSSSSYNPGPSSYSQATPLYKAEMTESQAITWQQKQQASNIKVEVPSSNIPPSSPVAPNRPFALSSPSSGPYPHQQSQQDIQAQIQIELQRANQLKALHHNRRSSSIGGGPASPLPSWTQPYSGGPTPVEPLTDSNPISPQASLQDPSFSGTSDRPTRPYSYGGGNLEINFGPSAIEEQSSLTEISAPSAIEHQSSLTEVDSSVSASRPSYTPNHPHPNHPNRNKYQQQYPSAIENQSSLTEVDGLPDLIEESSLTEVDNLPTALGEESSLTEVDNLPTALGEQSSLTAVDDLPNALHEQSSLTVVDDLPHALHEQSSLTVVDDLPHALHEQSSLTAVDDIPCSKEQSSLTTVDEPSANKPPKRNPSLHIAPTSPETYSIPTSPTTASPEIQPSAPSIFSMSNWTMPTEVAPPEDIDTNRAFEATLKSPFGSLHKRSPATMLDTSAETQDDVLIPVASHITQEPSNNSFIRPEPPVPAPKPASLLAKLNPQSGLAGAALTVSEEIHLAMLPSTPIEPKTEQTITHFEVKEVTEESEEETQESEEEEGTGRDDGVSAFIRELQSSITVSRSDSGSSLVAAARAKERVANQVTRTDSTSSRTSQLAREVISPKSVGSSDSLDAPTSDLSRHDSVSDRYDSSQSFEYAQLDAAQFEWTFTESEQAAYERIYSLWERPAEECVSSDIAGKVYMTLGLKNTDLFRMWQLINPDEMSVLSRTYFIAGLHLVNCKVVGYELPAELPDELMLSAAAVGRITVPPRPVQGPNTIVASVASPPQPMHSPVLDKASQGISSFMPNYNLSFSPPESGEIYEAYPVLPSAVEIEQQRQQIQQQEPKATYRPYQAMSPPPKPAKTNGYANLSSNSPPNSDTVVRPGPHAVHNMGMAVYYDEEPQRDERQPKVSTMTSGSTSRNFTTTTTTITTATTPTTTTTLNNSTSQASQVAKENSYSIHNVALYASPPDAWDHDAAAPELDVEGNYIKYRSDFKNDMTVSASVTANHPINPKSGVFYFEIMIDRFKGNSPISIGIASKDLRKNLQVGWDLNSWGYHSDDGFLYFGNSQQNIAFEFGYAEGDTVGCGVNFLEKTVFFTLNGDMLGVAFKFLKDTIPLYPAIGLSQAGTEINANFGDQTFLFNIVEYKKRVSGKPLISQPKITWNAGTRNDKVFQVLADGLSVIASGKDAGCIRGPKLSPRDKDVFYFEVTILYMPTTELGTIVVGICGKNQSMTETLGWNSNSYGYSGECGDFLSVSSNRSSLNARSQSGKMKARARGPPFKSGSVVGCGVDFASRELFFTLNGECLGQAFYELDVLDCFPCVSVVDAGGSGVGGPLSMLQEPSSRNSSSNRQTSSSRANDRAGFEFKANFGQFPFLFDLPAFEASEGLMLL